jgi:hypothetical protein
VTLLHTAWPVLVLLTLRWFDTVILPVFFGGLGLVIGYGVGRWMK